MELSVSQAQGKVPVTVLHVKGNIDSNTYEAFQRYVDELLANGTTDLVVDLRETGYMSSAGLRSLNLIYNKLRSTTEAAGAAKGVAAGTYKSTHLKLLAPSKKVLETLKMSGFDMFLDIGSDLQDTVALF